MVKKDGMILEQISLQEGDRGVEKSVFIREICGTMLKTRNPLAISDISLIFAPCFNLMVKL